MTEQIIRFPDDSYEYPNLADLIPTSAREIIADIGEQKAIPAIAKNPVVIAQIEDTVHSLPSMHRMIHGDGRNLSMIPDESVHLVVTSPPYWTLKEYIRDDAQLGAVEDYEEFLSEIDKVWAECLRVLVPGGRLVIVVGDVCLSRRLYGRHVVFPLHSSIQEHCRALGFDNLAPIIWYKIANAAFESGKGGGVLGKPYEPGGIIKNDIEYILFLRKPGGYRSPTIEERVLSVISTDRHKEWFQQVWGDIKGASTREHPAPYPVELAERLVRMFSFVGDIILDPFSGTGTTSLAAGMWGRNSIAVEVIEEYYTMSCDRLIRELGHRQPSLLTVR